MRIPFFTYTIATFIALTITFSGLMAQCETEFGLEDKSYFDNIARRAQTKVNRDDIVYVPIAFYIEMNGGVPVYNESNIPAVLLECNTWFASADLILETCSDPIFYEAGEGYTTINNVLNVNIAASYSGCGVNYGYGPNITINPNCNRPFDEILGHELGHALGLPHTHGYTNTGTTTELVDGSNCETAGDHFCDTPADPNLLNYITSSCVYTGNLVDANGDQYVPNTHNLMSYTYSHCPDHFSEEQSERMHDVAEGYEFNCCLVAMPEVESIQVCSNTSGTFEVVGVADEFRWYDEPEADEAFFVGSSFTTENLEETISFYISAFQGCETDKVKATAEVVPAVGVLSQSTFLSSAFISNGQGDGGVGGFLWYQHIVPTDSLIYVVVGNNSLWAYNGELNGSELVADVDIAGGTTVSSVGKGEGQLVLGLNDWNAFPELWMSDGTGVGTEQIFAFDTALYAYSNYNLHAFGDEFIFSMVRQEGHAELWKTDGTNQGTSKMLEFPETNGYQDFDFTTFNGKVFFIAEANGHGLELWSTDGTVVGTSEVKDINPSGSSNAQIWTSLNGALYLSADDGINGAELWKTDGTTDNTELLIDISADGSGGISNVGRHGNHLCFTANDGFSGSEPWISDGTAEGTFQIADINASGSSFPQAFTFCLGKIFFGAQPTTGFHPDLFGYDPVSEELTVVREFNQEGYSGIDEIFSFNDALYFRASIGVNNLELWRSDGTLSGTHPLAEIHPEFSSWPTDFLSFQDKVYFQANDGTNGTQFWKIDEPHFHICQGENIVLQAGNPEGAISWYDEENGGSLLGSGPTYDTGVLNESTSYYADLTVEGCTSTRTQFEVELVSIDDIDFDELLCEGELSEITIIPNVINTDFQYGLNEVSQSDGVFTDVAGGEYTISVQVSESCVIEEEIEIVDVDTPVISMTLDDPLCFGEASGSIEIDASGGYGVHFFSLDDGDPLEQELFEDLAAGAHHFLLTDESGCQYDTSYFSLEQPEEIVVDLIQSAIGCAGDCLGGFSASANGGVIATDYSFHWYDSEGISLDSTSVIAELCEGDYSLHVTDDNLCLIQLNELAIEVTEPGLWYIDIDADGYGDEAVNMTDCLQPTGYVSEAGDCDDTNDAIHPGAMGQGDAVDADCDGNIDQTETSCPGDYNFDGLVNASDLLILLSSFGCNQDCLLDANGDDQVDTSELLLFLSSFGQICS